MNDLLHVGKILSAHGIKGEVKVLPLTDDPNRFFSLNQIYLENKASYVLRTITNVRIHKNSVLITFEGITDRNQAEELKGQFLSIPREDAVPLDENQYFYKDLIGLLVYTLNEEKIGYLKDIIQTGATDIYVIQTEKKEILVPALRDIFMDIDLHHKTMKADIPKGLMEL